MQRMVWLNQIILESMLHVVRQAQRVEEVLCGVVCVDLVCIGGSICKGRLVSGINPGCSRTKQLGQDSAGEASKDGIRGRDHNERKKRFQQERGPHQEWQTTAFLDEINLLIPGRICVVSCGEVIVPHYCRSL